MAIDGEDSRSLPPGFHRKKVIRDTIELIQEPQVPVTPHRYGNGRAEPRIGSGPALEGNRVANNNVQQFRESLMMSKAELARKAGLSTLTIDRVEAGRPCRLDTKRKILLALGFGISNQDKVFSASGADQRIVHFPDSSPLRELP